MLIKSNQKCFIKFGAVRLRPGSTEVVPEALGERPDFKAAVLSGYVSVIKAATKASSADELSGDDVLAYVTGLNDVNELKDYETYTCDDKKLQGAVRKIAKDKVKEIDALAEKARG